MIYDDDDELRDDCEARLITGFFRNGFSTICGGEAEARYILKKNVKST
jgi:hypothetical protein